MTELFTIPPCESPRLKWLKKHNVTTSHNSQVSPGDECEITGEQLWPWAAYQDDGIKPPFRHIDHIGFGNTEHESIVDLAVKRGWKLWNETL